MKALWQALFMRKCLRGFSKNYQETWIFEVPNKALPSRKLTYPTKMEKVSFFGGDMWQSCRKLSCKANQRRPRTTKNPHWKVSESHGKSARFEKKNMANPESYCMVALFVGGETSLSFFGSKSGKKVSMLTPKLILLKGHHPRKKSGMDMLRMARWDEIPEFWGVQVSIHLKFQADFALLINWICCCGVCFWPSNPLGIHHQSFWWKEHQGAKGHSIEALSNETSGFFGDVNPSPNPKKNLEKPETLKSPQKIKRNPKKKRKRGSSTLCRVSFSSFSKQNI